MSSIWDVRRSVVDSRVAGVCGGLARHWNVDPVLVRVACVVLALSGGIGVVLYVAGWLLIPKEGHEMSLLHEQLGEQARNWPREVWVLLIAVTCLIAFGVLGRLSPFGFGPAVVLALIWYFGFYRRRHRRTGPADIRYRQHRGAGAVGPVQGPLSNRNAPPAPGEPGESWRYPVSEEHVRGGASQGWRVPSPPSPGTVPTPSTPTPSTPTPGTTWRPPTGWPPRPGPAPAPAGQGAVAADPRRADPASGVGDQAFFAHPDPVGLYQPVATGVGTATVPRSRSRSARRLRWVGLSVLAVVLGGLGVADVLGAAITVPAYLAAALAVVGLTLTAATRFGRARGLLPLGIVLLVAVIASTAATHLERPNYTTRAVTYVSTPALPSAPVVMDNGELTVDLSNLAVDRDVTYEARVGVGSLQVRVPADTNVAIRYSVGKGVISVYGKHVEGGVGLRGDLPPDPPLPGHPTLTLDLSVDFGHVEVRR